MTLDNSIVVLESIELERRRGLDRVQAAVRGVQRVWPAVLAATLTTVLVFVPVVFVQQEAGQLYSDIAVAVSGSVLASMLVAITVIPAATARLATTAPQSSPRAERLRARVLAGVDWLLATRRRRIGWVVGTVIGSLAIILLLTPPAEYLPDGEEPKVFARMNAPPGYNLEVMTEIGGDVERQLVAAIDASDDGFESGTTRVPPLRYINVRMAPHEVRIIAEPIHARHMEPLMTELTRIFEQYPGMRAFVSRGSIITSNSGGTRSINVDIAGPQLATIYDVAGSVYSRAREVFGEPRIQSSPSSLTLAQPLVEVRPRWERAAELGLTADDIGFAIAALTDGAYVDEFILNDDKIDIFVYSTAGTAATLDDLEGLLLYTPRGTVVPVASIADVVETMDTSTVRRVNGRRTVTLNVIPPPEIALETGVELMRRDVLGELRALGRIPEGVTIGISGAADQLDATREALGGNYIVATFVIYLLLVAIFVHWGYPLLIMTAIPLGIAGGIVGLWLLNVGGAALPWFGLAEVRQPFDMISMLGFLILMGAVVNNPILIVHRAIENLKEPGTTAIAAVREAVEVRLRPIAISTLTTCCGLAPLVLLPGAGAELYRGVGAIVLFGIVGAALVTLTLLPALLVEVLGRMRSPARDIGTVT
jgi:multidrug efflux pump subunit AcrB